MLRSGEPTLVRFDPDVFAFAKADRLYRSIDKTLAVQASTRATAWQQITLQPTGR
jgi:hypothetical protein